MKAQVPLLLLECLRLEIPAHVERREQAIAKALGERLRPGEVTVLEQALRIVTSAAISVSHSSIVRTL